MDEWESGSKWGQGLRASGQSPGIGGLLGQRSRHDTRPSRWSEAPAPTLNHSRLPPHTHRPQEIVDNVRALDVSLSPTVLARIDECLARAGGQADALPVPDWS